MRRPLKSVVRAANTPLPGGASASPYGIEPSAVRRSKGHIQAVTSMRQATRNTPWIRSDKGVFMGMCHALAITALSATLALGALAVRG